jgi:hypothetical protein
VICSVNAPAALVVVLSVHSAVESVGVNIASVASMPPEVSEVTVMFVASHVLRADPYFSVTILRVIVWVVFSVLLLEPVVQLGVSACTVKGKAKNVNKISFFI